jgi:phasin family protein
MNNHAFSDMFKHSIDFNQLFSSQRRNVEALTEAGQVWVEGAQEVSRASAETLRSNMETVLKNSKDVFSGRTPEASLAKQADFARSIFENTLVNLRELTEMCTKCGFEAFEVLNRRASESMHELGKNSHTGGPHKKK